MPSTVSDRSCGTLRLGHLGSTPTSAMTEDVPPRGRASHSLAVYHVPDNTLTPPESLIGKIKANTFTDLATNKFVALQSSTRTTRSLNIAQDQHSPTTIHHPCPPLAPPAEEPVARPVTRRVMYDPVRDSVTSSLSAASPSYAAPPTEQSTPEETKPALPYPEISVLSSALPAPSIHVRHPPRNEDDSVSGFSQRLAIANSRPRSLSAELIVPHPFHFKAYPRPNYPRIPPMPLRHPHGCWYVNSIYAALFFPFSSANR
ncbi:hypothetical protein AG1IA_02561 [Rhizoctonia solani AG-1 IA]|uniref:Uncharacterized protein n=1 Tax=Thanatephorus cucumeris (strain AG1-IA) TaxID=983506 RepID=L8X2R1_THACA|nr:hypothetical protein AG1IA_02561 [Rhizoctonia solani AG-1 IA]